MKIALAQLNYHIGNFEENETKIAYNIKKSQALGVDILVFSELAISGYPPLDMLEHRAFVNRCISEIEKIAKICTGIAVVIGGPALNEKPNGKLLYNAAYFLAGGEIQKVIHKTLLPTYDIFDEYRYFEPNNEFQIITYKNKKIALTICEDIWFEQPVDNEFRRSRLYNISPLDELSKYGPDIIINIAASPFSYTRVLPKKKIFTANAKNYDIPLVFVNQVGAQTELIFEGGSKVVNGSGKIVRELNFFAEDFGIIDVDDPVQMRETVDSERVMTIKYMHDALVMGIRDYFLKMGFKTAVLGLSGGIDSAVTLALAAEALGNENVRAMLLPSKYSSEHSVVDSIKMVKNLNIQYDIVKIEEIVASIDKALSPVFKGMKEDITEENIQSRIRGTLLMAISNKFGNILLNTSNKSEAAVGYGTLYGDMSGGLSVLGDVYKTDVYELARYINLNKEIIPNNILTKAPSAELKPDQKDTDSLPEYGTLDKILFQYIEMQQSVEEIIEMGYDDELTRKIIKMVNANEYKRYQTPPILRISSKAFGFGRRMPLVAKY
jgi:NAD+ synthase (glutamine-hydrolysing)